MDIEYEAYCRKNKTHIEYLEIIENKEMDMQRVYFFENYSKWKAETTKRTFTQPTTVVELLLYLVERWKQLLQQVLNPTALGPVSFYLELVLSALGDLPTSTALLDLQKELNVLTLVRCVG